MNAAPEIHVSHHAVRRFIERIGAGSEAEARCALTCHAVQAAIAFGARVVRLESGRIIIKHTATGATVVTVVPLDRLPVQLMPEVWGGPPSFIAAPFWPDEGEETHGA